MSTNNGTITNYPLCWPDNVPRTAPHLRGWPRFAETTVTGAAADVAAEVNRLNGYHYTHDDESLVISSNLRPKLNGSPLAGQAEPADSGVAVYFKLRFVRNGKYYHRPIVLTCDKWRKVALNLSAIAKDIEAQRARSRWGCTNLEQAFRGYVAIPERCGASPWWTLLGVPSDATHASVKDAYRTLAKTGHPDQGGDRLTWDRLQEAYEQALAATNGV